MPIPSPQDQVAFLKSLQRLLTDGLFVASYKYALLRALADLAVVKGNDSGEELRISVTDIAGVFVKLYWRQVRPYPVISGATQLRLRQNTGKEAAVIKTIVEAQDAVGGSLSRLRREQEQWKRLVRDVTGVVSMMPLWKLQRVGEQIDDFLYPNVGAGSTITLRPGIAYCFRQFYGMIRHMVEGAWLSYVRRLNSDALGNAVDLDGFLFGSDRSALDRYRPLLRELQQDNCFYCRAALRGDGAVDHFVPWARYPVDLGHNFVLAHSTCNGRKSDHLAAEEHLAAWNERNERHARDMASWFDQSQTGHDIEQSVCITRWAYSQTATAGGLVWVRGRELRALQANWERLISARGHAGI